MVREALGHTAGAGAAVVPEAEQRRHQDRKTNHCPDLEQVPFHLGVVKLRKQVRACEKLHRGKREMAYFLIVHKPIWLGRSVPSWPEQREEAFQQTTLSHPISPRQVTSALPNPNPASSESWALSFDCPLFFNNPASGRWNRGY